MKIRTNDQVLITAGKDKGKKGKVLQVFNSVQKVLVENINMAKKSRRATKQGEKGQLVMIPRPLHVSNVKLICPKCGQASRLGYKITEGGKFRVCKKCQQEI